MTDEITQNDCQGEADIEPRGDLLVMAEGRARFLRDRGEIKTPELLDELKAELTEAREIIRDLEIELVNAARSAVEVAREEGLLVEALELEVGIGNPGEDSVIARARTFLKGDQNDG